MASFYFHLQTPPQTLSGCGSPAPLPLLTVDALLANELFS